MLKNEKGITLIALIITIIVMLILVGVTINVALSGGLFTKADEGADLTTTAAEKEALSMAAIAAWNVDTGVDFDEMQLPEGFEGTDGTYTNRKSKKIYKVDKATAKVTEGETIEEVEKIVTAEDEEYNYWKTDGNGTIIYYDLPEGIVVPETLVIPCQIGDEKITTIGAFALVGIALERNTDGSVVLDTDGNPIEISGGTTVMTGVKNIVISKGINKIEPLVFSNSLNLTNVTLPTTITEIGAAAFAVCTSLNQINLPEGLITIEQAAFVECTSLKQISFPKSLNTIGGGAFQLSGLAGEIVIPASVDNMGEAAFDECENLTTIIVMGKVEEDMIYTDNYSGIGWEENWIHNGDGSLTIIWKGTN